MTKKITAGIALILLSIASFSQNGYVQKTLRLPMSTEAKSYYVKQIGTNYVLNGDIIVYMAQRQCASSNRCKYESKPHQYWLYAILI
jgi:hypothetical protein